MQSLYQPANIGTDGGAYSWFKDGCITIMARVAVDTTPQQARDITDTISAEVRARCGSATKTKVRFNYCLASGAAPSYAIPDNVGSIPQADGAAHA